MRTSRRLSVYLAGPEVFLPDGREVLESKREILRSYGLEPVSHPAELGPIAAGSPWERGVEISRRNEELVRIADACIANLTPFRGISADVGTVYELGVAAALGKRITAYSNDPRVYRERVRQEMVGGENLYEGSGRIWAPDGMMVEDHDMRDNLMLHGALALRGAHLHGPKSRPPDVRRDLTAFVEAVSCLAEREPRDLEAFPRSTVGDRGERPA